MSMRDQFDKLNNVYTGATEAGDAGAISRLFTEDAILLAPENPPASGRQAIQESHERELEETEGGYNLIIKILDFQEQGDTAHAVGTWETEDESGNWLDVVQRQSDDSLLFRRVCWNVS
jgi:ketosteroid isomerase-like protein